MDKKAKYLCVISGQSALNFLLRGGPNELEQALQYLSANTSRNYSV